MVAGASALAIGALSIALATAAQASHAGQAAPGRYAAKVEVRPGQSLWSLAEAYDPDADPRLVIQQIQQLNSMAGTSCSPARCCGCPEAEPHAGRPRPGDTPARARLACPARIFGFDDRLRLPRGAARTRVDHNI